MRIFITGIGVISAIGNDAASNLESIRSGRTGIAQSMAHGLMLAEVKKSNEELVAELQLRDDDYSRTSLLGIVAAKEAWKGNKINPQIRTGLISSTSVGGMDKVEAYYSEMQNDPSSGAYQKLTFENGRTTEAIASVLGINGYIGTIATACSSGANAIMQGARLIEAGKLDRVVAGGSDPLAGFNIKGFGSLMIYSKEICKPFDASGKGLNLGEGAGFLVLENEHSISKSGNTPLCELSGWNNSSDAYHQTSSSPVGKGATLAMKRALDKAGISPDKISYINAHGTGTENNDMSESIAIKNVFGEQIPPFSSTKGFTGHTLAAAGAVEAVYCVQSILSQATLPNINYTEAMPATGLIPETSFKTGSIENVLSNSFGFGGNCTSLVFRKI